MIKPLLSVFAVMVVAYALREWGRSRLVGVSLLLVSIVGLVFVWFPSLADQVAARVGVTRGADLILYCYSAISFLMILNLALKQRELYQSLTLLARHIALAAPATPEAGQDAGARPDAPGNAENANG